MDGLFIGRFQPFHTGHLQAVKWAGERVGRLFIVVGSSQACYEPENPFTVGERVEMIWQALKEEGLLGKCVVLSAPDLHNNALWVAHIVSLVPAFDVVYSNNTLTLELFRKAGKRAERTPFFERGKYDATKIRASLGKNRQWESSVPAAVKKVILHAKGPERMRSLRVSDKQGRK